MQSQFKLLSLLKNSLIGWWIEIDFYVSFFASFDNKDEIKLMKLTIKSDKWCSEEIQLILISLFHRKKIVFSIANQLVFTVVFDWKNTIYSLQKDKRK